MKKLLLIVLLLPSVAYPKGLLPALRDVRSKIDKTISEASITLKEALGGKKVIKGQNEVVVGQHSQTLEQQLVAAEQRLAGLYWANCHADAGVLNAAVASEVRSRIKTMIESRSAGKPLSTVYIASQLADEQKVLDQINTDSLRMPELLKTEQDNKFFKGRIQQLRETCRKAQETLKTVARSFDSLLAL